MSRSLGALGVAGLLALAMFGGGKSSDPAPAAAPSPTFAAAPTSTSAGTETFNAPPAMPVRLAALPEPAPAAARPVIEPHAEPTKPTVTVRAKKSALRVAPRAASAKAGTAAAGENATELSRSGAWRELEFKDGRRGWINVAALEKPTQPASDNAKPKMDEPASEIAAPPIEQSAATLAVAALIVSESRARYGGSCGCPDDQDRAGRRCGGRSAYSKAGGKSLFCYAEDVPTAMIAKRQARR